MKRLADVQRIPKQFSAVDKLPPEILEQLVEARKSRSHSVPEMVDWLHDEDFQGAYLHISCPMLYNWFGRRGVRAEA